MITDGKRNDIGTTMQAYAAAHLGSVEVEGERFVPFGGDALTVNGYLGSDGINPLLSLCEKEDRGIFVLTKTSNPSSGELQNQRLEGGNTVYYTMGLMCEEWGLPCPESTDIPGSEPWWAPPIRNSSPSCAAPCRGRSS